MTASTFREVEKGPTFEIYQGPLCVQRLDWTRDGAVRSIYVGHIGVECAEHIFRRWEALVRAKQRITMLHDAWETTGYESGFRVDLTKWTQKNPSAIGAVHMVTRSKLVNMAVSVVSLALPGLVTGYSKRSDFDLLAKKLGLPLNPPIPQGFAPAT